MFLFHRRRAERFAQLLDEAAGIRHHAARPAPDDGELTDLVDLGHRLRGIDLTPQADPEFRTGLRAMLMATIEREGIGATALPEASPEPARQPANRRLAAAWLPIRSRRARGAVAVGLAVGTLAVAALSTISVDARPGDPLYGMKRSAERAQLALSSSQQGRGELYLEFAKARGNEAAADRHDILAVLTDMDDETRQGVRLLTAAAVDRRDPASLDTVDAFVAGQRHTIAGMLGALSGDARTRTVDSLQLLDRVQKRVDGLRKNLDCADAANWTADDLGPVPGACTAHSPAADSLKKGAGGPAVRSEPPARTATVTPPATGAYVRPTTPTPGAPAVTSGTERLASPISAPPTTVPQVTGGLLDRLGRLLGGG
nr:DUF5667 domain-containing protein [Planosporangium thailandense]